jgi:CXXX repeat modification system protein
MHTKKVIGKVTETERDEIKFLIERKASLFELFKTADAKNLNFYSKIVKDMGKTSFELRKWWDEKSKHYKWESEEGFSWEIDFENCNIYLKRK